MTSDDDMPRATQAGALSACSSRRRCRARQQPRRAFRRSTTRSVFPTRAAVNNLTVTVALTDQQSVAESESCPGRSQRGSDHAGTEPEQCRRQAITGQGLPGGNAIGVFGYAPGTPGTPGIAVGTIFDDNATRNIFDPDTTGTNGNTRDGLHRLLPARGLASSQTHFPA